LKTESFFATLQNFEDKSKGKIDKHIQEAIKFCLSKDEYYVETLLSTRSNGKTQIEKESISKDEQYPKLTEQTQTQTETVAVEQAIRRNKGRLAVPGMIIGLSSVEQVVTHTEYECLSFKYSFEATHNPPVLPCLFFYLQLRLGNALTVAIPCMGRIRIKRRVRL
jgi:hypothetical protein